MKEQFNTCIHGAHTHVYISVLHIEMIDFEKPPLPDSPTEENPATGG